MTTSHEPAYPENGMPKARSRAYQEERAKAGVALTMTADPHVGKKIMEGREDDIRPCVGATYCLDRIYQAGDALCIHNAATGHELTMPHDISSYVIKAQTGAPLIMTR